jgi:uncharacterized protein YkwD
MVVEQFRQRQSMISLYVSRRIAASSRFGHCFRRTLVPVGMRGTMRDWGREMSRQSAAFFFGIVLAAAGLFGCTDNGPSSGQPSFYIDLAQPNAALDANAAQSMISGYRGNNGLGAVTIDPELMRLAGDQASAMAARDKLDHDATHPFQERIRKSGFDASVAVENIGAGYHTLAEAFSGWRDSPPHRANMLNSAVTRMGIAAVYTPKSKYKVYWALILASPGNRHS